MSKEILMPALSPTMTEGNLTKWLVKKGQKVKAGDVIAEIETDKATMEVEAVDEGYVSELLFKEGDINIPVSKPIAIISQNIEKNQIKDKGKSINKKNTISNFNENSQNKDLSHKKENLEDKDNPITASSNTITMRQAIRDTIAEEMRKNKDIFMMGVEVAEYEGAYKLGACNGSAAMSFSV